MRVAILLPGLASHDAVGHDALAMREFFDRPGVEVEIFAPVKEAGLGARRPSSLKRFLEKPEDVLLYHYTVAWDQGLEIFRSIDCTKIIKYHNVTPPDFFEPFNPDIARVCRLGREMIPDFARSDPTAVVADSLFNEKDWEAEAGQHRVDSYVVPPFHRAESLLRMEPDLNVIGRFARRPGSQKVNFLYVGRMAPNKKVEHLIEAFALFRELHNPASRLLLAGRLDPALKTYNALLHNRIQERGLGGSVQFLGRLSEKELKAAYLSADAFVLASEHEGFCVPLVEAMALGVPILAVGNTAVPETAGAAALTFPEFDPLVFATAMQRLVRDPDLAFQLADAGQLRYLKEFSSTKLQQRFESCLAKILPARGLIQ